MTLLAKLLNEVHIKDALFVHVTDRMSWAFYQKLGDSVGEKLLDSMLDLTNISLASLDEIGLD